MKLRRQNGQSIVQLYNTYYRVKPANVRMSLDDFKRIKSMLEERRHTFAEIARVVRPGSPNLKEAGRKSKVIKLAAFLGADTGNREYKKRSISGRIESKDAALFKAYKKLRHTLSMRDATKKIGVDEKVARRWGRKLMGFEERMRMASQIIAQKNTSPLRPIFRKMLALRNPDGTFLFPTGLIARACKADFSTIKSANESMPRIRTRQQATEVYKRTHRYTKAQFEGLFSRAQEVFQRETEKQNGFEKRTKLMPAIISLTPPSKRIA